LCCRYFVDGYKEDLLTAEQVVCGDTETNKALKEVLSFELMAVYQAKPKKHDRVLELMSGYGRNFPVLKRFFKQIEMLEQSQEFAR